MSVSLCTSLCAPGLPNVSSSRPYSFICNNHPCASGLDQKPLTFVASSLHPLGGRATRQRSWRGRKRPARPTAPKAPIDVTALPGRKP